MEPLQRPYAIVEAPSILGLKPTGVERLAGELLRSGLGDRLQARHAGRVEPPSYSAERDPQTKTLDARAIARWTPQLADAVGPGQDKRHHATGGPQLPACGTARPDPPGSEGTAAGRPGRATLRA